MSTYASTTATPLTSKQLPSIINEDEQQCLSIKTSYIDRICSKTCRARKTPFEQFDNFNRELSSESHFLPFCSNHTLNHSINQTYLFDNITENECRQIFNQLIKLDEEARKASELFVTYMEAIDSASDENRYSIIIADCQQAYRTWTCSVNIPYYHRNRRIPPCQTICDEVERVCPTFRPSDREPLFAGQPLFFCNGGIVTNSNYGHRPHCFDTCHLGDGSSQRHSVSSSSNQSLLTKIVKEHVTTPLCFEIEPLLSSPTEQSLFVNDSITNYTSNDEIIHQWGANDGIEESVGISGNKMTIYGIQFNKAKICKSKIIDVMVLGGDVRINNFLDSKRKPLPIRLILERAENALGRIGYNLLYNNCEHFATECRYGQATSNQVQVAVGSTLGLGLILTGAAIFGAYLLSDSSHDEKEKKIKKIQIKS
ncbi:unnamed protein product [Adineta steineri]|uniref:LRAT domain-containing protein n=1 Tax=Adineta steineri TaxID=433720 RepID=A0A814ST46_9BILA|nr:unnamed protein product [Adineta steineri]CAF1200709.1 unnamed protein product [Adineta steineri]